MTGVSGNNNVGGVNGRGNVIPLNNANNDQPVAGGNTPSTSTLPPSGSDSVQISKPQKKWNIDGAVEHMNSLLTELEGLFNDNKEQITAILEELKEDYKQAHIIRNQKSVAILAALGQINPANLQPILSLLTIPERDANGQPKKDANGQPILRLNTSSPVYSLYKNTLLPKAQRINPDLKEEQIQEVFNTLSEKIGKKLVDARSRIIKSDKNLFKRENSSFKGILSTILNPTPTVEEESFLGSLGLSSIANGITEKGVDSPFSIDRVVYKFLPPDEAVFLFRGKQEGQQAPIQKVLANRKGELQKFIDDNLINDEKDKDKKEGQLENTKVLLLNEARVIAQKISSLVGRTKLLTKDAKGNTLITKDDLPDSDDYRKLQEDFVLVALKIGLIDSSNTLFSQIASLVERGDGASVGNGSYKFNAQSLLSDEEIEAQKQSQDLMEQLTNIEDEFQNSITGKLSEKYKKVFPDFFKRVADFQLSGDPIIAGNTGRQFDYTISLLGIFMARKTLELAQTKGIVENGPLEETESSEDFAKGVLDPINLYNISYTSFQKTFEDRTKYFQQQRAVGDKIMADTLARIKPIAA